MKNYAGMLKLLFFLFLFLIPAQAVRVKDVSKLYGIAPYTVTGYGLVVGLRNSGDGPRTQFTTKGIINMLRNMGIEVPPNRVRIRNVAAVMISAQIPPFSKLGSAIDVTVSSIGDAKSLEGGTLLMSPLHGPDGKLYMVAQGPVNIGGFNQESSTGLSSLRKNHALVGQIPNGGVLQKELLHQNLPETEFKFVLNTPDFTSAVNMSEAINQALGEKLASALDAAAVMVFIPQEYAETVTSFLAKVENVEFVPSELARVVLNEKTGTIVAGGNISISSIAVSHGNITISINSEQGAEATIRQTANSNTRQVRTQTQEQGQVEEAKAEMKVMPKITNVNELANALNSLGVPPRDIISIFQSIKKSGALHADLVTM